MKLITLNVWGGKVFKPLMDFLEKYEKETDIFCFQEVLFGSKKNFTPFYKARINIFDEIEKRLPGFVALTYPAPEDVTYFQSELLPDNTHPGQAIFVRKSLEVCDTGGFRGYPGKYPVGVEFGGKITGSCQWASIKGEGSGEITIMNLHGLWQKDTHKADTPARLSQSGILRNFLNSRKGKKILGGDFNLNPDGKSIKILEKNMINLIKKFGFTSTRSGYYTNRGKFADYILVSPDVAVNHFEVLQNEVSDHLPLLLEFN